MYLTMLDDGCCRCIDSQMFRIHESKNTLTMSRWPVGISWVGLGRSCAGAGISAAVYRSQDFHLVVLTSWSHHYRLVSTSRRGNSVLICNIKQSEVCSTFGACNSLQEGFRKRDKPTCIYPNWTWNRPGTGVGALNGPLLRWVSNESDISLSLWSFKPHPGSWFCPSSSTFSFLADRSPFSQRNIAGYRQKTQTANHLFRFLG